MLNFTRVATQNKVNFKRSICKISMLKNTIFTSNKDKKIFMLNFTLKGPLASMHVIFFILNRQNYLGLLA